ncbi:hypothetical protein EYZ11_006716 [Aspergillus tanneri]|uniref:Amidohydrolase-related domain-containing protein n=1 Tax=Aspergillus tanneri TaxID=1220188 RepID=A0A4S3JH74_9EURO|nr:hypothetical protein EYZ11_006716 [Aspergillus tanneri]
MPAIPPYHILLRNGTVLVHEGARVRPLRGHDVLIEGNTIKKIGQGLELPPGDSGNMQSFNFRPDDIFWGQLTGCLQSIDGGVTTVVDHAHLSYSPEHVDEAIRASVSSGIRTVFCYSAIPRIKNWSSKIEFEEELVPSWWLPTLERLAKAEPFGNGRVNLGAAIDFLFPQAVTVNLWKKSQALNLRFFTCHYVPNVMPINVVEILSDNNLLGPNVVLSHANGVCDTNAQKIVENNVFVSATPDTELQMGLGDVVAFQPNLKNNTSLGVDCHSNNSADLLTQMRLAVQHSRAQDHLRAIENKEHCRVDITLEDAFNLGTIQGAKAINMDDQIGSLAEGKRADIVVFDTTTPAMVCAAEEDPINAILLHAGVRDIDMVIVDGQLKKENGRLCPVEILDRLDSETGAETGYVFTVDIE